MTSVMTVMTMARDRARGALLGLAALEAAIWAVAGAADFRDAILRATNLGDDADTTAAIAGQLAGALFGASGIPQPWLAKLAMRERIGSLADALHRAAHGERLRWESDLQLHAWWADAEGRLLAGEYPGHGLDVATTRQKLALLAEAGITTIIDLTDAGDGLAAYQDHLSAIAAERGIEMRRVSHPIPDVSVTTPEHYEQIVADIDRDLAAGRRVFVHCWGGVGRTGTVVGCWHVSHGAKPAEALARIAAAREGTRKAGRPAPETPRQVEMLHEMEPRNRSGG